MSARREVRRRGVRVRLRERDVALLHALARLRVARSSDLHRLVFRGIRKDTAAARLRALLDGGYLEVRSAHRAAENLYFLSPLGRREVEAEGGTLGPLPRPPLEHHLAIVKVWTELATLPPPWALLRCVPDWELRADPVAFGAALVPDLFALLEHVGVTLALAVEVDLGTEPLRTLRAKVRAYRTAIERGGLYGWEEFALGFAISSASRLDRVRALLDESWPRSGIVWDLAAGPAVALDEHPLTDSPHRKGGRGDASA